MTVLRAGTRGDALRVRVAGGSSDVASLAVVGSIRGVTPLAAAGRCGPGTGALRSVGAPPRRLQWREPGSGVWGGAVRVVASGSYLLEGGEDRDAWLRVRVDLAWLAPGAEEARVFLADRHNELGPDDVAAGEAEAGAVEVLELELHNVSANRLDGLKAWLDPAAEGLELSADGDAWSAPTSEGSGIALGHLDAGAHVALYVRRTIGAGAPAAAILNQVHFAWTGA